MDGLRPGVHPRARARAPIEPRNINRTFDTLIAKIGVPRIRFMIFGTRAPFLLYGQAVDLQTIKDLLGHSSIGVTSAIYVDVLREVQREAVDRLGHLFGQAMTPTRDQQVRSRPTLTGVGLCVVAAPRVGLEPTTLRFMIEPAG
jgi:hypothetical protein